MISNHHSDRSSSARPKWGLTALLLFAMGMATFSVPVVGLLASFLIEDLHLTRTDIGTIVAVNTFSGALLSPVAGRLVDWLGGTRGVLALFVFAGLGLIFTGVAPTYGAILGVGLVLGLAQALGNPATNKAIALYVMPEHRGIVTGLKQSGVQAAIFIGGLTVPSLAGVFGWRLTLVATGVLALAVLPAVLLVFPTDRLSGPDPAGSNGSIPRVMWRIAAYGFLLGFAGSAMIFIPLFAQESLGLSVQVGGIAVAVAGGAAMTGRVLWARYVERTNRHRFALFVMAGGVMAGSGALLISPRSGSIWLWVGALTFGLTSRSWNAVGMLAVLRLSPLSVAGKATGRVLFGFLLGLTVGPRIFGELIDRTGSYDSMWILSIVLAVFAVAVLIPWVHSPDNENS